MALRDVCGTVGGPIEGEQKGENPAFRAGKGQEFPTCPAISLFPPAKSLSSPTKKTIPDPKVWISGAHKTDK